MAKRKALPACLQIMGGWRVGNMDGPQRNALVIDEARNCKLDYGTQHGTTDGFRVYIFGYTNVVSWWNLLPPAKRTELRKWLYSRIEPTPFINPSIPLDDPRRGRR